ncbi:phosphoribosylglycinamide formyltransferase [Capillibacterium thermochitinicola]|uniref:Phosphoribosylglycinamide formyltransferase n=1 Tax=Capillibacterium thermochitinicola TaxID=2699427 RepID=A0A8J6HX65_9FIRM|nr:phosphoribosylglycinamide formyltransferase [Capillibacterium thermochitinicola]MBA2133017.1 phosphoribosylglycinamide formyltransferase [Capillibacterium thermochitinicola]
MKRIAVLVSGNGSNLEAIINAINTGRITNAKIVVVVSDKEEAYALVRAEKHKIPSHVFRRQDYPSREAYDRAMIAFLQEKQVDLVVMAGFMRLVTPEFVAAFRHRIMNIHPSLLPAFPGTRGVADALAYGVKVTGCTVHFVDEGMDTGPIILQEAIPVRPDDTVESLQARIHTLEHRLYPQAIDLWVRGKIKIIGRRCFIDEQETGLA